MFNEKALTTLLYVAISVCLGYMLSSGVPEYVIGPIHGEVIFNFFYQISIGYIVSFMFYKLIDKSFQKREEQIKRELLKTVYRILVKRLCECAVDIEMKFELIWFVEDIGAKNLELSMSVCSATTDLLLHFDELPLHSRPDVTSFVCLLISVRTSSPRLYGIGAWRFVKSSSTADNRHRKLL